MLDAYQETLIALVRAKTLSKADWFELVNLLKVAKVPIRPEMAEALAQAAADATTREALLPQDISSELRGLVDELGRSADDPFMVVEALAETRHSDSAGVARLPHSRARSVVACSAARGSTAVAPGANRAGKARFFAVAPIFADLPPAGRGGCTQGGSGQIIWATKKPPARRGGGFWCVAAGHFRCTPFR